MISTSSSSSREGDSSLKRAAARAGQGSHQSAADLPTAWIITCTLLQEDLRSLPVLTASSLTRPAVKMCLEESDLAWHTSTCPACMCGCPRACSPLARMCKQLQPSPEPRPVLTAVCSWLWCSLVVGHPSKEELPCLSPLSLHLWCWAHLIPIGTGKLFSHTEALQTSATSFWQQMSLQCKHEEEDEGEY